MEPDTPPEQSPDGGLTTDFRRRMSHGDDLGLDVSRAALEAPSIHDEALRLLARRGDPVPAEVRARDLMQPHESRAAVTAIWARLHARGACECDLCELAEALLDVADSFQTWRSRHMRAAERIIGSARGTGGSAGVTYPRQAIERRVFPELCEARRALA